MTEYKLNTYIEWTDEDRAKGECPVPNGSEVTMWFDDVGAHKTTANSYDWGNYGDHITAYLIHSVPREPIVRWLVVGGAYYHGCCYHEEKHAKRVVANNGGRVVKLVEEME